MAHIIIPRRKLWQPSGVVLPNYGSPLANGLDFVYSGQRAGFIDEAHRGAPKPASVVETPIGTANYGLGTTSSDMTHLKYTGNFTLWVYAYILSVGSGTTDYSDVISTAIYASESSNAGWVLQKGPLAHGSNGSPRMIFSVFNNNAVANYQAKGTSVLAAGQSKQWAGVFNGGAASGSRIVLFEDGTQIGNNGGGSTACATHASQTLLMPGTMAGSSIYVVAAATWKRPLLQQELQWLYREPWQLFGPAKRYWAAGIPDTVSGSAGIPSGEAFGADGAVLSTIIVGSTGIASGEAFGSGGLVSSNTLEGSTGIASGEAFGADGELIAQITGATGIPSGEAFGADGLLEPVIVGNTGIPSGEAFGTTGFLLASETDDDTLPYRFYINGVDRSEFYHPGTLKIENPKAAVATATFTFEGINVAQIQERRLRYDITEPPATTFSVAPDVITWQSVEVYKNGERQRRGASYDYTITGGNTVTFTVGSSPIAGDVVELVYFDPTGITFTPVVGDQILIYSYPFVWNSTLRIMEADRSQPMVRIYAGSVNDIDTNVAPTTKHPTFEVGCTDYTQRITKRQFTYNFPGGTLTSLLEVMQTQIFDDEGITWVDRTDPGITLPKKDYDTAADDVLNELGNATGLDWKIDYFLNFRFAVAPISPTAFPHGTLEDDDDKTRVIRTRQTRAKYRNVQGIRRTGQDRTNRTTETYTVDAGGDLTGTYRVRLFMESKPIVTVNGTEQVVDAYPVTLGGADCYYKPDEFKVQFLAGHFPPALATVVISYTSNLGNTDYYTDSVEVAARAALEGGSGKYDRVSSFGGFSGVVTADLAAGLSDRFGTIDLSGVIETDRFGILPGQTVVTAFENPGLSGTFYVESVSSWDEGGALLRHSIVVSRNGKKGNGATDTLGGGIGSGGGWSSGGGEWGGPWDGGANVNGWTESGGINVYTNSAPQQYSFFIAPSVPGCTNPGMANTGATSIPRIVPFPGVIREVQAYLAVHTGDQDIVFDVELNGVSIFDPVKRPTFSPHASATPDFTIQVFDDITPIAVQRGDLLQVILVQNGASGAITDPTGEQVGQDAFINVVVY